MVIGFDPSPYDMFLESPEDVPGKSSPFEFLQDVLMCFPTRQVKAADGRIGWISGKKTTWLMVKSSDFPAKSILSNQLSQPSHRKSRGSCPKRWDDT